MIDNITKQHGYEPPTTVAATGTVQKVEAGKRAKLPKLHITLGRLFCVTLNLETLANFWKSLNLSVAKIKVSLFFSFFDQTGEWQKIKHITTKNKSILP